VSHSVFSSQREVHYCHIPYPHPQREHTLFSHSVFTCIERTYINVTFRIHIHRKNLHYCHILYPHSQREHTFLLHFLSNSYTERILLSHSYKRHTLLLQKTLFLCSLFMPDVNIRNIQEAFQRKTELHISIHAGTTMCS